MISILFSPFLEEKAIYLLFVLSNCKTFIQSNK